MRLDTRLVHTGGGPDRRTGAVNPAIYLTSTFEQAAPNEAREPLTSQPLDAADSRSVYQDS